MTQIEKICNLLDKVEMVANSEKWCFDTQKDHIVSVVKRDRQYITGAYINSLMQMAYKIGLRRATSFLHRGQKLRDITLYNNENWIIEY